MPAVALALELPKFSLAVAPSTPWNGGVLDAAGIAVDNIAVRTPSLDDVFHALTRPADMAVAA